ncbi:MAG: hypothetical protein ACJ8M1_03940 [Chthoniobacterales bacterium]
MRIFIAGILGGIAMFIWTSIAHMAVRPLSEAGIRTLPNQQAVMDALRTNLGDNHGLYVFPAPAAQPDGSAETMEQMAEKVRTGPSGFLVYHPHRPLNMAKLLGVEFGTEVLEAILVVFLLSSTRLLTTGSRILFVTIAGVMAAIATNVSYWNWYGFPKRYTLAYMFIQIVGFFLIGLVSAFILRNRDPVRESDQATSPNV